MDDLRTRAAAFVRSHCAMPLDGMKMMQLIDQYACGEPFEDLELQSQLSVWLQYARSEAARFQGAATGPARDALMFYQEAAAILQEITAEAAAGNKSG
jgi:hypothetical protein